MESNVRAAKQQLLDDFAKVYADAFGKDPAFYDFYRAMQSYDTTFANPKSPGQSTILLSPDNDYLRQFKGKSGQ